MHQNVGNFPVCKDSHDALLRPFMDPRWHMVRAENNRDRRRPRPLLRHHSPGVVGEGRRGKPGRVAICFFWLIPKRFFFKYPHMMNRSWWSWSQMCFLSHASIFSSTSVGMSRRMFRPQPWNLGTRNAHQEGFPLPDWTGLLRLKWDIGLPVAKKHGDMMMTQFSYLWTTPQNRKETLRFSKIMPWILDFVATIEMSLLPFVAPFHVYLKHKKLHTTSHKSPQRIAHTARQRWVQRADVSGRLFTRRFDDPRWCDRDRIGSNMIKSNITSLDRTFFNNVEGPTSTEFLKVWSCFMKHFCWERHDHILTMYLNLNVFYI